MSYLATQIYILQWIDNDGVKAFHDHHLQTALLMINADIAALSGGSIVEPNTVIVTQANFTTAVDCPLPSLVGHDLSILMKDGPILLVQGVDFVPYVGGGFTITIPGFDASTLPNLYMQVNLTS